MAGIVLGLNLKPHPQINLEADFQRAIDHINAKNLGVQWTKKCSNAVLKFRRFLMHQRGQVEVKVKSYEPGIHAQGLPARLVHELEHYQQVKQRNWRPARMESYIRNFWGTHLRLWSFLCQRYIITELGDVKRQYILDYVDHRLSKGYAISSINTDLRYFRGLLVFLQEQGYSVSPALQQIPGLKQPEPLPKYLTDSQIRLLRNNIEHRVVEFANSYKCRDALLDRAVFYLLWQGGMRLSEVEELLLEDLDLPVRKLTVRKGKGQIDRTVYLTDTAVQAVQEYLVRRGPGLTKHVFIYRHRPLNKDLVRDRIKAVGKQVGVKVSPHRLRHTAATQLLNAGCRITSIQRILGHKRLNTTMIYARVYDKTVAEDYFSAMKLIEERLDLLGEQEGDHKLSK